MWVGGSTLGAVAVHHVGLRDATTRCFCPVQSVRGNGIPRRQRELSRHPPPTTGASQPQVVRVEDLNEIVQSLVRKALAGDGGQQMPTTSDSSERPVGVLGSRSGSAPAVG